MIVRRAELSDIPAVAALERAEFPDGADEGMLARLWETDGGVILAAEEGNDLLGYVWARFVLDEGDIGNVAVAPDSRRRGIGAALLKALFAESERRGAAVLQLEVREAISPRGGSMKKTALRSWENEKTTMKNRRKMLF